MDPLTQALLQRAQAVLDKTLGAPGIPPADPIGPSRTLFRKTTGYGPPVVTPEQPQPFSLNKLLLGREMAKPAMLPVNGGEYHDVVQQMNNLHPQAMQRVPRIVLRHLEDGTLGDIWGKDIRLDPDQINQNRNWISPIDAARHEVSHVLGFQDDTRRGFTDNPDRAQDIDEASQILSKYRK